MDKADYPYATLPKCIRYYFAQNGVMEKGWMKKGKEYYYYNSTYRAARLYRVHKLKI